MQKYTDKEIFWPDITRFVINFIALKLIQQKRHRLKAMAKSQEWTNSHYSKSLDCKKIKKNILLSRFRGSRTEIIASVKALINIMQKYSKN